MLDKYEWLKRKDELMIVSTTQEELKIIVSMKNNYNNLLLLLLGIRFSWFTDENQANSKVIIRLGSY